MKGCSTKKDSMTEEEIGKIIVDCAIKLHMDLGPGLFVHVYEVLLTDMLRSRGLKADRQVPIPIQHMGKFFDEGFAADILVEEKVIVELKSVEKNSPVHKKQLITYLKLSKMKLGYVLNFGQVFMKDGISRLLYGCIE